jgi:hypothetical protein
VRFSRYFDTLFCGKIIESSEILSADDLHDLFNLFIVSELSVPKIYFDKTVVAYPEFLH